MPHGHDLLLSYLSKRSSEELNNKTIIEIGSTREFIPGQNSTEAFVKFCIKNNMKLISVDMDEKCSNNVTFIANKYKFENIEIYTMKGEDFLKKYDKKIDFIYLDAFDYDHGKHSTIRKERYKSKLNCEITNELCHKMHLECCLNLNNKFNKDGLLCFDDILDFNGKRGKGVLAIPYLKQQKYKLLQYVPHAMIFSPP